MSTGSYLASYPGSPPFLRREPGNEAMLGMSITLYPGSSLFLRREPGDEAMPGYVNNLVPSFFHMGKNSVVLLLESLGTQVWICETTGKSLHTR